MRGCRWKEPGGTRRVGGRSRGVPPTEGRLGPCLDRFDGDGTNHDELHSLGPKGALVNRPENLGRELDQPLGVRFGSWALEPGEGGMDKVPDTGLAPRVALDMGKLLVQPDRHVRRI